MLALQDVFDMRDDSLFKATSGLAGGIGRMHDACGALLAASMMLGFKYGRGREETEKLGKLNSSGLPVGKLYKWFEKEFGSANCKEICTRFTGGVFYDKGVPWQAELAREAGLREKCAELVGKTAARAAEMLWDTIEEEREGENEEKPSLPATSPC
ncbi:C-GCAxxG-C-C family protein [Chloroflexota bacterium]